MKLEIKVYERPNGEIQRVQYVRLEDWAQLDFLYPKSNEGALDCFRDIYQNYLVPAFPWVFENMVMFQLPKEVEITVPFQTKKYGVVKDTLTAVSAILQKGVHIICGKPVFLNSQAKVLWQELEKHDCIRIVTGKRPTTKIIPVGDFVGYLSENEPDAALKVNANFFIMDPFDCATVYDQVGMPFGLCVKDGVIESPPLFGREALLVDMAGTVTVKEMDISQMTVEINGKCYVHGQNATIYTRPNRTKTPAGKGEKIVITGQSVVAVKENGSVPIPASGFVLCPYEESKIAVGSQVTYHGLEEIRFGIQVGNSIIRDGVKTEQFISQFYNIRRLERIAYPPCLYPMDFAGARAARIALGADEESKPVLLWAEGAGKLGYTKGKDSTGASLVEMAEIAKDLGMRWAINLDGGGSAQMLLRNQRCLRISDRNKADNSDAERLIPLGLILHE